MNAAARLPHPRRGAAEPKDADYWIRTLDLRPHPEGGFFRETHRSGDLIGRPPERFGGPRCASTAILFLLKSSQCSRLHRLQAEEIWHFHTGSPLTLHLLCSDGRYAAVRVGPDPEAGDSFHAVIPARTWAGATVNAPDSFALVTCTVAPGFEYADFELGDRAALLRAFPRHAALIERLTPPAPSGRA